MPRGLWYILNLLRVIQSVILKGEFEGGSRKLASGTSGREMGWQRIKSENAGDSTLDRKERKMKRKRKKRRTKWWQWSWLLLWWGFGFGTKKGEIVWSVTPRPFSCSLKWKKKKNEKRRMYEKMSSRQCLMWCELLLVGRENGNKISTVMTWQSWWKERKVRETESVMKWQLSQCWNILAGCSIFEYLKNIFGISLNIFEYLWISLEYLCKPKCWNLSLQNYFTPVFKLKLKSWNIFFQNCKKTLFADSPRTQASSSLWLDKVRGGEQIITREQNGIMWSKQKS